MKEKWHSLSINEVYKILKTQPTGLTPREISRRLKKYGLNEISIEKREPRWRLFFKQFKSPLIYLLLVAALISFFLKEYIDLVVILGAVFLNVLIGFFQEDKAKQALARLKKIIRPKAQVIRGGRLQEIERNQLVPGDIIVLRPGDRVPADARLIEVNHLKVNEAILTGEWLAATKKDVLLPKETPLGDRDNMVFMGTIIEEGLGKAVVVATGLHTELGRIAELLREIKEEKTPFQKKIARFANLVGWLIGMICGIILLIGLLNGYSFARMFMIAVAIAVSAIPEGLPIGVTVILAIGMQRILKKGGLVRSLLAAETLGSTSVICTDKTGTLTQARMVVDKIITWGEKGKEMLLKSAVLANAAYIENPNESVEKWVFRGRPTDRALLWAGWQAGFRKEELEKDYPQLDFLPFSAERKYLVSLHQISNPRESSKKFVLFICGAPEKILDLVGYININDKEEKITSTKLKDVQKKIQELTQQGFRVVAGGYIYFNEQDLDKNNTWRIPKKIKDVILAGLIGLRDSLREGVTKSIQICQRAGIKPVIVTGDHLLTAQAIAKEIGLQARDENILEGEQLDRMEDRELERVVRRITVYARVEPRHKLRIIQAWQNQGEVVAMTGDGVNDAPALKKADIGVALGSGTEVAREASDLILLNDNFSVIVKAIEQGRVILDNIKKMIVYLLSDSFTEVVLIGGSLLLGLPLPLLPAQILWVNLLTDGFPNLALAFEPKERDVMRQKPLPLKMPILDKEMKVIIFIIGLVTDLILLGIFYWLWQNYTDLAYVRTVIFVALGIDSLFYIFSCKSLRRPIWRTNLFSNIYLIEAVLFSFLMLISAVYWPFFQKILRTVPLSGFDWILVISIGVLNIVLIEAVKFYFINSRKEK